MGHDRHSAPGPGGRERSDRLRCERRLHRLPGSPVRRRRIGKGGLAVEQGQKPLSVVITAGQRGDSPQSEPVLEAIRVPRFGRGRPRGARTGWGPTRRTTLVVTGSTRGNAVSRRPSRSRPTRSAIVRSPAHEAADRRSSTTPTARYPPEAQAPGPPQAAHLGRFLRPAGATALGQRGAMRPTSGPRACGEFTRGEPPMNPAVIGVGGTPSMECPLATSAEASGVTSAESGAAVQPAASTVR